MNWEKLEFNLVKSYYWCFILVSTILISEGIVRWQTHNPDLFDETMQVSLFINLIFCLYLPLFGLWCLSKQYSIGYLALGLMLAYLGLWLRGTLMYSTYSAPLVFHYNLYWLKSLF